MNYRRLGRSGLKVSELSFGSWVTYGNQMGDRTLPASAWRPPTTPASTSSTTPRSTPRASRRTIMGEALRKTGWPRSSYIVSTKFYWGLSDGPEREEHAQPQIPAAGDRRLARAALARLRRPRVLPSRRSGHADRGDGVRDARHDRRRQGALLGHVGMDGRRDHGGVADRRAASPAQAGDGAAAIQPAASRARREGIRAALPRHRARHDDLEPARLGPADRQVQRRHPAGLARHAQGLRVAGRAADGSGEDRRRRSGWRRSPRISGCTLAADVARVVPQESERLDGDHRREPRLAGGREHEGARRRAEARRPR